MLVVTALPGCRTFDMDYIQKFGPFLDYSLGEWSLLESDETGFEDGAVNCRSWRVAFRDKDGGAQILAFDNAAFNQSDEAHFARFVYAKALDIAAGRIREAVAVEDGRIAVETRLLTCAGVYSGAEAQTILSTHEGLRLSVLDAEKMRKRFSNKPSAAGLAVCRSLGRWAASLL